MFTIDGNSGFLSQYFPYSDCRDIIYTSEALAKSKSDVLESISKMRSILKLTPYLKEIALF